MSALTVEQLLLIPGDQIDYSSLDDELLKAVATQRTEPFMATSALGEIVFGSGLIREIHAFSARKTSMSYFS